MNLARYSKLITALLGVLATVLEQTSPSAARWEPIVTAVATALGVYLVPNTVKSSAIEPPRSPGL